MTTRREDLVAAAKRLAAAKDESLHALIDATEKVADIDDQLAEAKRAADLRVRDALKAGWTEKELATIGFDLGDGAPKPARKTRAKKTTSTLSAPAASSSQAASAAADVTT
ncbi:hypothetical protein E0H75_42395 [Kribbella capetownensis]|uniref:Uncharacterized protein n=1 Tax=Kribbella capetownensis TaxID=1572659 RepID=A0A4R0IM67_9ACTN|nr:hypothetical protein [Kribbella capetownensis]TCC33907.1 hypothetical protein E0H75_42395 [Kribbella capetownensis]